MLSSESEIVTKIREDSVFWLDEWGGDFDSVVKFPSDVKPKILAHSPSLIAVAACYGSVQCFRYLAHHRSDMSKTDDISTPLSCFAAVSGSEELVNKTLEGQNQLNGTLNRTALHYACQYGQLNIVKLLIMKHDFNINSQDCHGLTPLHWAIESGNLDICKYLLSISEIKPGMQDKTRKTVLHKIASNPKMPHILVLLPEIFACVDINQTDSNDWTCVHYAADTNNTAFLRYICRTEVKFSDEGETPLHIAARRGFCDVITWLLTIPGLNVNQRNSRGATALHEAVRLGSQAALEMLLTVPEIDVNAVDENGCTALHAAVLNNHADKIKALLEEKRVDVNLKDFSFRTALHVAIRHRYMQSVMLLLGCPSVDVNAQNKKGQTALIIAAKRGYTEVVRRILERKEVTVTWRDKKGVSALTATENEEIREMITSVKI